MKIRIKDDSVRFRLTQSEVKQLGETGLVLSSTQFIDTPFIYSVEISEDEETSVFFIENKLVLNLPRTIVDELVNTDRVGFEGQVGKIKLLIEKDFICIDNSVEDQTDNYPNPNVKC